MASACAVAVATPAAPPRAADPIPILAPRRTRFGGVSCRQNPHVAVAVAAPGPGATRSRVTHGHGLARLSGRDPSSGAEPDAGVGRIGNGNVLLHGHGSEAPVSTPEETEMFCSRPSVSDDSSYLWTLGLGSVGGAAVIKYGSILLPDITRPNIVLALLMVSLPVVAAVLILLKASSNDD